MLPAPWPCICQNHGSRLFSATGPSRTTAGSFGGGVAPSRGSPGRVPTALSGRTYVGTPLFPIGDMLEMVVMLEVMIAGRKTGFWFRPDPPEEVRARCPLRGDLVLRDLQDAVRGRARRGEGQDAARDLASALCHSHRGVGTLDAGEADEVEHEVAVLGAALAGDVHIVGQPVEDRRLALLLERIVVDVGQIEEFVAILYDGL